MKLTLTQKEMALLFEVAQIGCEGCGMWLTGLADDNYSWFKGSEIMDRLNWSKERVGGVMASLTDKGVVGTDDTMAGVGKMSYLNFDAKSEKNDNGEWVVIEGNDLYNVFEEWEKDYPEYCDNPFKEEASKSKIKSENKKIIFGSLKDHKAGVADYVGEILGYATLEDEAIWAACKENGVNPPRLTKEYLIDKLNLINGLAEKALEMLGTMEGGEKIC